MTIRAIYEGGVFRPIDPPAIDIDVILAAQALSINDPSTVIATANPQHLVRFVSSENWQSIAP